MELFNKFSFFRLDFNFLNLYFDFFYQIKISTYSITLLKQHINQKTV